MGRRVGVAGFGFGLPVVERVQPVAMELVAEVVNKSAEGVYGVEVPALVGGEEERRDCEVLVVRPGQARALGIGFVQADMGRARRVSGGCGMGRLASSHLDDWMLALGRMGVNRADLSGSFSYFPIPLLSFALSLSKGRPFMVRQAHHERNWLIIERPCYRLWGINLYNHRKR